MGREVCLIWLICPVTQLGDLRAIPMGTGKVEMASLPNQPTTTDDPGRKRGGKREQILRNAEWTSHDSSIEFYEFLTFFLRLTHTALTSSGSHGVTNP